MTRLARTLIAAVFAILSPIGLASAQGARPGDARAKGPSQPAAAASEGETRQVEEDGQGKKPAGPGKGEDPAGADPLAPLPPEKLPPRTRPRPDPAASQFERPPVHVRIEEMVERPDGTVGEAETPVLSRYLAAYLERAGHRVVDDPGQAAVRLEGKFEGRLYTKLEVLGRVVGWKFRGSATLAVRAGEGTAPEEHALVDIYQESGKSAAAAALQLRRYMAKLLWDKMLLDSAALGDRNVAEMIARLTQTPDPGGPASAEDVTAAIADIGLAAVPTLLESISDTRVVQLPSNYPGLDPTSPDRLRVFHIADKALEDIFQKVSRMSLDVGPGPEDARLRFLVQRGWELEWTRFCPAYRDAEARRAAELERRTAEGQAKTSSRAKANATRP